MAAGVDISASGGTPPPPSGGLKPLITALDKYQKQLAGIEDALLTVSSAFSAGSNSAGSPGSLTTVASPPIAPPLPATPPVIPPVTPPVIPPVTPIMPALGAGGASGPVPVSIVNPLPVPVEMANPAPAPAAPPKEKKEEEGEDDGSSLVGAALSGFSKALGPAALHMRALQEVAKAVAIALEPLEAVFNTFGEALKPIATAVSTLLRTVLMPLMVQLKLIGKVIGLVLSPLKILASMLDAFSGVIDAIGEVIEALATPIEILAESIALATEVAIGMFVAMAKAMKSAKSPQTAISDAFKGFKTTISDILINPLSAIPDLMGRIREAIDTLNPGAMIEFDLAMRDLMAVFGEALLPVVKIVTSLIRKFADALRPILQALAPAFEKLALTIGDLLTKNIETFAGLLERMIPAFQAYLEQVVWAVERQGALAEQSQANEGILNDVGSWFANWFRTNEDIKASTVKQKQTVDPIRSQLSGMFGGREAMQASLKNPQLTGAQDPTGPAFAKFLESAIELDKTREQFIEAKLPGKNTNEMVGKGGLVEQGMKGVLDNLQSVFDREREGKATPAEVNAAMNLAAESQANAIAHLEDFMKSGGDKKGAAQGLAAAQNPAFKSIADLSRDTILKAFQATSSQAQMKEKRNEEAAKNVANLPKIIFDAVAGGMGMAMKAAQDLAGQPPNDPAFAAD